MGAAYSEVSFRLLSAACVGGEENRKGEGTYGDNERGEKG